MSKTYRRKGYEKTQNTSWDKQSNSIAGYYTEKDWVEYNVWVYREPTKREYFKRWYLAHGESRHANAYGPGKTYKKYRMSENRCITKRELAKFYKDYDYEPMIEEEPRSHWWDWS
jgi:hypothetical protein